MRVCYHGTSEPEAVHAHRIASAILLIVVTLIVRDASFIFLFVLFLVWLFPHIGSCRAIRILCEALWAYSAHVHMVLCARWLEQRVVIADAAEIN